MTRKKTPANEVALTIDAFKPATLPMARFAEYVEQFAALLGNESEVHFARVTSGSCVLTALADEPSLPKIRDRANRVKDGTAAAAAARAHTAIDNLLASDNAIGAIYIGGAKVIEFPGRRRSAREEIGPVAKRSTIDGQIFSIGGKDDTINVQLRDGERDLRCVVSIDLARALARHLLGGRLRLSGLGQWYRSDGSWSMKSLVVDSFLELNEATFSAAIDRIGAAFSEVSPEDFMKTMQELRSE
jgi:hypothetical protein